MARKAAAWACSLALPVILAGAGWAAGEAGSAAIEKPEVVYLGPASDELRGMAGNVGVSDDAVWRRANNLFEGITRRDTTEFGSYVPAGWESPDLSESNRRGTVEAIQEAFERTSVGPEARRRRADVPPPCDEDCRRSLRDAVSAGRSLQAEGKVRFDARDGSGVLKWPGVVGAFVYERARAIGVFYSDQLAIVAKYAGDSIAAATAAHELGHADDHSKGELSPEEVKAGERSAFKREFDYLVKLDPKGEILSKLRYNLVGKPWVPQIVSDYLEHLAEVRLYGERGDFEGLVEKLGYSDRADAPRAASGSHP